MAEGRVNSSEGFRVVNILTPVLLKRSIFFTVFRIFSYMFLVNEYGILS